MPDARADSKLHSVNGAAARARMRAEARRDYRWYVRMCLLDGTPATCRDFVEGYLAMEKQRTMRARATARQIRGAA